MDFDLDSVLTLLMVFFYLLLMLVCIFQISRIIYYRHTIRSFQFWFMFICLIWCGIRSVFFAFGGFFKGLLVMIMFWVPTDLQFATFSLLVLFYAFLLYQSDWVTKRKRYVTWYMLLNLGVVGVTTAFAYIACHKTEMDECTVSTAIHKIHHIYMTIQFLFLVLVYAYYSRKLHNILSQNTPFSHSIPPHTTAMTRVMLGVFSLRLLYNFAVSIDPEDFGMVMTYGTDGFINVHIYAFSLLLLWEIIPSAMVLFFFRVIPRTSKTVFSSCCRKTHASRAKARAKARMRRARIMAQARAQAQSGDVQYTSAPGKPTSTSINGIVDRRGVVNGGNHNHLNQSLLSAPANGTLNYAETYYGNPYNQYYTTTDPMEFEDASAEYMMPKDMALDVVDSSGTVIIDEFLAMGLHMDDMDRIELAMAGGVDGDPTDDGGLDEEDGGCCSCFNFCDRGDDDDRGNFPDLNTSDDHDGLSATTNYDANSELGNYVSPILGGQEKDMDDFTSSSTSLNDNAPSTHIGSLSALQGTSHSGMATARSLRGVGAMNNMSSKPRSASKLKHMGSGSNSRAPPVPAEIAEMNYNNNGYSLSNSVEEKEPSRKHTSRSKTGESRSHKKSKRADRRSTADATASMNSGSFEPILVVPPVDASYRNTSYNGSHNMNGYGRVGAGVAPAMSVEANIVGSRGHYIGSGSRPGSNQLSSFSGGNPGSSGQGMGMGNIPDVNMSWTRGNNATIGGMAGMNAPGMYMTPTQAQMQGQAQAQLARGMYRRNHGSIDNDQQDFYNDHLQ